MTEGKQSILALTGQILREMRAHALAGWPWALVWTLSFAAALYAYASAQAFLAPKSLLLVSFVGLIIWEAAVLRQLTGAGYAAGRTELRYTVSLFLYAIILILGVVMILFPVILSTMALWALVSFEFDGPEPTQEELTASFEAFQSHPLFALCVLIFFLGIAGVFALVMRGAAYAAASVSEGRVVAMEAFQWTRGRTLYILGAGFLVLAPFVLLTLGAVSIGANLDSGGTAARMAGSALVAIALWPFMLALQVLSAEIYRLFRTSERNSPQPEAL